MTLQIAPTRWYSWDVTVSDESGPLADIATSWWREQGAFSIDGETYRARREGVLSGDFVVEGPDGVIARAEKTSIFRREFLIRHDGRSYTLRPRSMWGRAFVLLTGTQEIGSLAPKSLFSRKAAASLPDDLPLPVRAFVVWLTMIMWRRAQSE